MVGLQKALGLDLGTATSTVAVFHNGQVEVVREGGCSSIPSVVAIRRPTTELPPVSLVGEAALRREPGRAPCIIRNVKKVAGRSCMVVLGSFVGTARVAQDDEHADTPVIKTDAFTYKPEAVLAMLLKKLSSLVEENQTLGGLERHQVAIAVPAYFDAAQRQALKNAAKIAELGGRLTFINETSAAAVAYASTLEPKADPRTALVMDLGAGGSGLSVVEASGVGVKVLATLPRRLPGGLDLDEDIVVQTLLKALEQQLERKCPLTCRDAEALYTAWERAKPRLAGAAHTMVAVDAYLPGLGYNLKTLVSDRDFRSSCSLLMVSLLTSFREVLQMAKVERPGVQDVVLVGGCSRIPMVRRMVEKHFETASVVSIDPDVSIAVGAALFAGEQLQLEDVTPMGFSFTLDPHDHLIASINPNERIPVMKEFVLDNSQKRSGLSFATMQKCGDDCVVVARHRVEVRPEQEVVRVQVEVGSSGIPEWRALGEVLLYGRICFCMPEEEVCNLSPSSNGHEAEVERNNLEAYCCGVISGEFLSMDSPMMKLALKEFGETVDWIQTNPNLPARLYREKKETLETLLNTALDDQSVQSNVLPLVTFRVTPLNHDNSEWDENWDGPSSLASKDHRVNGDAPGNADVMAGHTAVLGKQEKESMAMLLERLRWRVVAREGSHEDASGYPELREELAGAFRTQMPVDCLAEAVLSRTMDEIREAGKLCLLVDTTVMPERELVSFIIRYVQPWTGIILERLVALVEHARDVNGRILMRRFCALCKFYRINWKKTLCGVSMDPSRITEEAFHEFLFLLRQESEQEMCVVYNGSHRLSDLICQAGESHISTSEFFDTLGALREFFGVGRRAQALVKSCDLRVQDLKLSTTAETIAFVAGNFRAVNAALLSLKGADPATSFQARRLLAAMKGEFLLLLLLFDLVFSRLENISHALSYSGSTDISYANIRDELEKLEQKTGLISGVAMNLTRIMPGKKISNDEINSLEAVVKNSVATLRHYLTDCMCVLRDIETLYQFLELSDDLHNPSFLFNWLTDVSNVDLVRELKQAQGEYAKMYGEADFACAADCLNRLRQLHDRTEYRLRYPTLLRCLEEVLTLPLVPAGEGERRLTQLRGLLNQAPPSQGPREAELIIQSSAESGDLALKSVIELALDLVVEKTYRGNRSIPPKSSF